MSAAAQEAFENAVSLETNGDLGQALSFYLKAQELDPQDIEIAYRTAAALLQTGQLEEAQSQLRRIVFAEPDHVNARSSLASCQVLTGDYENAICNFSEVLDRAPNHKNALYGLSRAYLEQNRPKEAEILTRRLLAYFPESAEVQTLFAESLIGSGNSVSAVAAFRKALKANGRHIPALIGLSQILLLRKQYAEVIELTVTVAQLSPTNSRAYYLLSTALEGKGLLQDALEACCEASRLSPKSSCYLTRLSILARKLGDGMSALRFALEAYDCSPDEKDPIKALGAAFAALDRPKEARSVLTGTFLAPEMRESVEKILETSLNAETILKPSADTSQSSDYAPAEDRSRETTPDVEIIPAVNTRDDPLPNVLGLSRRDVS